MSTEISAKEEVPNIPGTLLEYPSERDKRAKDREERSREIESRTEEWGNGIDPDKYSPSQLNQYVLWRLTNYQNRERTFEKKMDTEDLFNEFWEDFNTFELSHFKMLARDVIRPLRHFLRDHGVWVRNKRTYSTAKSLYDCTRSEKNIWLDEGHDSGNPSAEQNENDTKDSNNSNNTKTEPISFNPANYNQTQKYPEPHQNHKDIANLTRTYNDEIKYSGETSDNFDNKFNIFMDYCTRFGISSQALHDAFPCMLKGMSLTFYYNKCRGKSIENLQILMKSNFEGPEYQRYNLKRWNKLTFQNIIDSNPDKNPMEQITILTITLDKMQKTLSPEWQSEAVMHNKIVSACKDIEACKMACYRPSQTVAGLILDLRSGVEIHNKPLATSSTATYHSESLEENPSNNNAYFTDRRYHDRSDKLKNISRSQQNSKPYWICKQVGCWSNKHSPEERAAHKKKFMARINNRARQYIHEMDDKFDDDIDVEALFQDIDIKESD
ncbi:hypothetical protein EPUL_006805, partial [Erysiphe pulchra]